MMFYLGTHEVSWLSRTNAPLFISRRRLSRQNKLPVAIIKWALDSGGFSELSLFGEWRTSPDQYINEVSRYLIEIGKLEWAAQQDWMCEPFILNKTGFTIPIHQQKTIDNYLYLINKSPGIPWVPVLQGFHLDDYLRHVDSFQSHGIDLRTLPRVGIGSICRRQGTIEVQKIIYAIHRLGISLHGFGLKTRALTKISHLLKSADSMAWSFQARRRRIHLRGCKHAVCSSCIKYAIAWRKRTLRHTYFEDE